MLDGHGSQVRVRDKIRSSLPLKQHLAEHSPVPFARMHDPHAWLVQPTVNAGDRLIEGQGMLKDVGVGADADERAKDGPAKAHR
jgi:hypothetical protein